MYTDDALVSAGFCVRRCDMAHVVVLKLKRKNMRQRILGYDVAKGIAMFLVVLLHYSFYTRFYSGDVVGSAVTSACVICVPLFFAVNGALLLPRPLDVRKHYRRLVSIVITVAVWKSLAALFFVFVDGTHAVGIKDFLTFQLGGSFGDYPSGYFWFMNALIAVYLVYPAIKLLFDHGGLRSCVIVLFVFVVCKDTASVLLDIAGYVTHHEFTSLLGSLDEFNIFGNYGYVLLYFIVGGVIGSKVDEVRDGVWPFPRLWSGAFGGIVITLCYICIFAIQRFQHVTAGTNLTVDYGYWLLPTFLMTIVALMCCLRLTDNSERICKVAQFIGGNTFGVYMLHMGAIIVFSKLQTLPILSWMGNTCIGVNTLINIVCAFVLYACCLAVSGWARKVPGARLLFNV